MIIRENSLDNSSHQKSARFPLAFAGNICEPDLHTDSSPGQVAQLNSRPEDLVQICQRVYGQEVTRAFAHHLDDEAVYVMGATPDGVQTGCLIAPGGCLPPSQSGGKNPAYF